MARIRLFAVLLGLAIAASAHGQSTPQASLDRGLNRHIQAMIRSQFNVPEDYDITLGTRGPSTTTGYDALPAMLTHEGKTTIVNFLISTDGKTLARLETFDLSNDPAFAIDITGRPVRGNPDAKVTVIGFDDLECPVCARMHQALFPGVIDRYKDTVRFIYKDNPLTELHPWAFRASVDANCLAAQSGKVYWDYVDYLHTHGQQVNGKDRNPQTSFAALDQIARREAEVAKLEPGPLNKCLAKQDEAPVRSSLKEAQSLGLNYAPALFVNGERISGWIPEAQIWRVIDRALRDQGIDAPAQPAPPDRRAAPSKSLLPNDPSTSPPAGPQ